MKQSKLTKEELEEVFEYRDGELWRKGYKRLDGWVFKEKLIESKVNHSDGYCRVWFKGKNVKYHRIIWALINGQITENCQIDHINGNKIDNRIENLRVVTNRENCQNYSWHRDGRLPGCYYNKERGSWMARAKIEGKTKFIGRYPTELEAHNAYIKFLEDNNLD